ncbi:hypothetical protein Dsin_007687 [Dipteronia sinensis]|uniref:Uncharacterized protein n=1 Tax=Dipteronia sinensis TaxID=43782 RepID=A0AAE0B126_9ROSI|nr:hypothetical protein Dsin_007684 [Dipteronia sinensis]KAK3227825.1 hypothetical protein Dsin_007687 [Dipteronia sinensis]
MTCLIWRSSEVWHGKRPLLVDAVKSLLDEQNIGVRKALSEHILWPFLLKMIIPRAYTGAGVQLLMFADASQNCADIDLLIPMPCLVNELFAHLVVLLHNPLAREQLATHILAVFYLLFVLLRRLGSLCDASTNLLTDCYLLAVLSHKQA